MIRISGKYRYIYDNVYQYMYEISLEFNNGIIMRNEREHSYMCL